MLSHKLNEVYFGEVRLIIVLISYGTFAGFSAGSKPEMLQAASGETACSISARHKKALKKKS
jgi:hypothetical protein